jgi:hypothetical protein
LQKKLALHTYNPTMATQAMAAKRKGYIGRSDGLTRYAQVAGPLLGTVFKDAHSLSRNYGSAWTHL